jgi:hypothetical protein
VPEFVSKEAQEEKATAKKTGKTVFNLILTHLALKFFMEF